MGQSSPCGTGQIVPSACFAWGDLTIEPKRMDLDRRYQQHHNPIQANPPEQPAFSLYQEAQSSLQELELGSHAEDFFGQRSHLTDAVKDCCHDYAVVSSAV